MSLSKVKSLEMETEEHYRKKEATYRSSTEYDQMVLLYPILKTSIKNCQGESLVA